MGRARHAHTTHAGIDGTVFSDQGRLYFVYSAYVGPNSDLIIARMLNPWTLGKTQIDIAQPTFEWEERGGRQILEGPEFLQGRGGQRILLYSASACWSDDYSIGMLVAAPGKTCSMPRLGRKRRNQCSRHRRKTGCTHRVTTACSNRPMDGRTG